MARVLCPDKSFGRFFVVPDALEETPAAHLLRDNGTTSVLKSCGPRALTRRLQQPARKFLGKKGEKGLATLWFDSRTSKVQY